MRMVSRYLQIFMTYSSPPNSVLRIAIVGPCSSGKSSLRKALNQAGYTNIRNPSQEHTEIQDRWLRVGQPDILIYLDVDYKNTLLRRPHIDLGPQRIVKQKKRLEHALSHADLYIDTNQLTANQIAQKALSFLDSLGK